LFWSATDTFFLECCEKICNGWIFGFGGWVETTCNPNEKEERKKIGAGGEWVRKKGAKNGEFASDRYIRRLPDGLEA